MIKSKISGGVVLHNGKVLVVNQNGNSWSLPKGHQNDGESTRDTAAREIHEESGISQLTFIKDLGTYQRYKIGLDGAEDTSELKTITMFLYTTPESELKPIDPHNPEARWVESDKVEALLTHTKDKAFFHQAQAELQPFI